MQSDHDGLARGDWLEKGVQFFYVHSDPFLRLGLNGINKSLGR